MKQIRAIKLAAPIFVFFVSLVVVLSDLFYIPDVSQSDNIYDIIFYVGSSLALWVSAAFLLNTIFDKFFWGGVFNIPIGKAYQQTLQDIVSVLIYIIAIGIFLDTIYDVKFTTNWILVFLMLALVGFLVKTALQKSGVRTLRTTFNLGDWIKLINKDGNLEIIGEVVDIERGTIRLKTEENNLLIFNRNILDDFIIQNYWGMGEETRFEIKFCIDMNIPVKRAKRILEAGAKQAIISEGLLEDPAPEVIVADVNDYGIVYSVYFWIKPWLEIFPGRAKDRVISVILDHLAKSGVSLAYPKNDIFFTQMPTRQSDLSKDTDRRAIISRVELFDSLNEEELALISQNLTQIELEENKLVIKQGDEGDSMFILVEGLLDVFIKSTEGDNILVGQLQPGQFFGEMSMLTGEARSATVSASTAAIVFEIGNEPVSQLIENRPEIINDFSHFIAERHEINVKEMEKVSTKESKFDLVMKKIKSFFGA